MRKKTLLRTTRLYCISWFACIRSTWKIDYRWQSSYFISRIKLPLRGHHGWILKRNWKFYPFYNFLLNDTRIHVVLDYRCILRFFVYGPLKNSALEEELITCVCLLGQQQVVQSFWHVLFLRNCTKTHPPCSWDPRVQPKILGV